MTRVRGMNTGQPVPLAEGDHVVIWLLARLAQGQITKPLTSDELSRAAGHLATCISCRVEWDLIDTATALHEPDLELVHAHAQPGPTPSDSELATYAAVVELEGVQIADERFPALASHLHQCDFCREAIHAVIEPQLAVQPGAAPDKAPVVATDVAAVVWESVGAGVRRLLAPYQIWVQDMSLRITSALEHAEIATEYAVAQQWRHRSSTARVTLPSFRVDLCDNTAAPRPWVRAHVQLRPLSRRRISGAITTTFVAAPEDEGEAALGVRWRLERQRQAPGQRPLPVPAGTTDAAGGSSFHVREFGDFVLTFEADERQWMVPFSIRPDGDSSHMRVAHNN